MNQLGAVEWTAIAAIGQFVASVLGLVGLGLTVHFARKAWKESAIAAIEARRSADSFLHAERPHFFVKGLVVAGLREDAAGQGTALRCSLTFRNYGRSPLWLRQVCVLAAHGELPTIPWYGSPQRSRHVVTPNDDFEWPDPIPLPSLSAESLDAVRHREAKIFVYGYARYSDAFGQSWPYPFAYEVHVGQGDTSERFTAVDDDAYWENAPIPRK